MSNNNYENNKTASWDYDIFFTCNTIYSYWSSAIPEKLIQNHKVSNSTIIDCSYGGRGHAGTITFNYNFYYNKRTIQGIAGFNSSELNFDDAKLLFVGKTFPVVFDPDNPNNNYLLIRPKDFKKFNYSFPDSLYWIVQYVHSK